MRLRRAVLADELIEKRAQPALSDLFRIDLADRARRGVARIRKAGLARFFALLVRPLELLARKINLAADFDGPLRSARRACEECP